MASQVSPIDSLYYALSHGTFPELLESWEGILRLVLTPEVSSLLETLMAVVMVITGLLACLTLVYIPAPYGRYAEGANRIFGPGVPVRLAWLIQESPAFLVPVAILLGLAHGTRWGTEGFLIV